MDFTELIRKSNLAKKEFIKNKESVEEIKTALIENGVGEIKEDTKVEEIGQIIKNSDIGNNEWSRPKKWITMPNVIQEDSKYFNDRLFSAGPDSLSFVKNISAQNDDSDITTHDNNNDPFIDILRNYNLTKNKSEFKTGTDAENNFKVSANDFAYVMLCDISPNNNENILSFEGFCFVKDAPFTDINNRYNNLGNEEEGFWSDLFIQIDDNEPFNLSELARNNITVPTTGVYKGLSILSENYSYSEKNASPQEISTPNSLLYENIEKYYANDTLGNLISLFISLDYNDFSEDTLNKDKKQCIVKIWGNSFIQLFPASGSYLDIIPNYYSTSIDSNINDGIKELIICQPELVFGYDGITLFDNFILYGGNSYLNKLTIYDNISSLLFFEIRDLIYGYENSALEIVRSEVYYNYFKYTPKGKCNIKEIDLSHSLHFDTYMTIGNILRNTPICNGIYNDFYFNKLKNVEKITFPDINSLMDKAKTKVKGLGIDLDSLYVVTSNSNYTKYPSDNLLSVTPFCINLSHFIRLNKESIVDLVNKLPIFNKNASEMVFSSDNVIPLYNVYRSGGSDPRNLSLELPDESNSDTLNEYDEWVSIFNGNTDTVKKVVKKQYNPIPTQIIGSPLPARPTDSSDQKPVVDSTETEQSNSNQEIIYYSNEDDSLAQKPITDSNEADIDPQDSSNVTLYDYLKLTEDVKVYNSILVSQYTYDLLTEEDLNNAKSKGWVIFAGYNFPININDFIEG